jgi:hypothetical protein
MDTVVRMLKSGVVLLLACGVFRLIVHAIDAAVRLEDPPPDSNLDPDEQVELERLEAEYRATKADRDEQERMWGKARKQPVDPHGPKGSGP